MCVQNIRGATQLDCYKVRDFIRVDPIIKYCRQHIAPLFWSRERLRAQGHTLDFWREREWHGLRCGISIPLRHNQLVGSLNVAHLASAEDELKADWGSASGNLFLLIPFALEGLNNDSPPAQRQLSEREKECLKWSAVGKTSWEISRIVSCSERTVNFHLSNAIRKLGACNRRQAVAVAVARGIIQG